MAYISSLMAIEYIGTVLLRPLGRMVRLASGAVHRSYGITIPKEALIRLGWEPKRRVDLWIDEERKVLIVQLAPEPRPPKL